jgi:hypothetical protein
MSKKTKGKSTSKTSKTKSQLASDAKYGTDKAPKKGNKPEIKKDTGRGFKMRQGKKVSGRTSLGEVPDALGIYKGR